MENNKRFRVMVPRQVELRGQNLAVRDEDPMRGRWIGRSVLDDFAGVLTPDDARAFVLRYGAPTARGVIQRDGWVLYPSRVILDLAADVRAVQELAAALGERRQADMAHFMRLAQGVAMRSDGRRKPVDLASPELLRYFISAAVSGLLMAGGYRPLFAWDMRLGAWRMTVGEPFFGDFGVTFTSLGTIAHYLGLQVAGIRDWAVCSICGQEYEPVKTPAASRRNYCPDCKGSPEMWRRLKARQRAKANSDKTL
jgi:hypothetical protein